MKTFDEARTRLLLDFHIPEWDDEILTGFNSKDIVEKYEKCNLDCIFFYAKDHYSNCYYNTKIGHKHRMMGDRDFFGEFVSEAKKKGYIVGGYYSINWQQNVVDEDYWAKDSNGRYIRHKEDKISRWTQICYNSEGYLNFCKGQLNEILSQYEIDAIWLDMLNYPFKNIACYCTKCQRAFKEKYGYDHLPLSPSWDKVWLDFLDFRFEANYRFACALRNHIKEIKPKISTIFNYHAGPKDNWLEGQKPVKHSSYSDNSTHEIYPGMFGSMYPSIVPRYLKGLHKDKPFEIVTFRFNQAWDYTIKPLAQYKWEIMSAAMNGANILTVDQPFHNGELDDAAYGLIKEGYDYLKSRRHLYKGKPLKLSAIYFSQKTRDLYARENKEKYIMPFYGAVKMLVEEHLPLDIIFDENISLMDLCEYRLLILPNVAILDEEEEEKIKHFVNNGGTLIASDSTSLYDKNGNELINFGLNELFGVDYAGKTEFSYGYFLPAKRYEKGFREGHPILVHGRGNLVKTNSKKTEASGELKLPFYEASDAMFFSHNLHPPWNTIGPSLVINSFGKGKVFYLPFKIFASYVNKHSIPEHRKYIRNIIKSQDVQLPIEVNCPVNVDVMINEDKENYYIHFLSYCPNMQVTTFTSNREIGNITPPLIMEEPLSYKAEIKINAEISGYEAGDSIEVISEDKDVLKIRIDDVYESIKLIKI